MRKNDFFKQLTGLILLLLLLFNLQASGQAITVKGTVIDAENNNPIPGVNIVVANTTIGTVTDTEGKYSIEAQDANSILQFSFVGYEMQEIQVNGKQEINVALSLSITEMDQVVVVGYGTQRKSDLTGAVSVVKTENLERITTNNISKAIQGQASGVQVHGSGEPGASPKITIRGVGSFQNVAPLYVVDGIPVDHIEDFTTSEIESMQVLKDASACAIYGARGANGVIIITTKKGQSGKMTVTYEGSQGWQNVVKRMEVTNREQFQEMNNLARINDRSYAAPANDETSPFYDDSTDTDWQEAAFKTGKITEHSLTLSGGNDITTYNANFNYFHQSGTFAGPGPDYKRYSFRLNSNTSKGKFNFGQSIYYSASDKHNLTTSQWGNTIIDLILAIPTIPIYDENNLGGYGGAFTDIHDQIVANIIATNNLFESKDYRNRFLGITYAEYEFIEGLKYRINLSYDRTDWRYTYFEPQFFIGDRYVRRIAIFDEHRGDDNNILMENTISYDKVFGDHSFTILAGYTVQKDTWRRSEAHAEGYTEPYFKVLGAGTEGVGVDGFTNEHNIISYLGRINYAYNDKYLLTANFRRDGSSRFSEKNRWANFPSLALGWKIHNEDFFNVDFISMLKLRAGYGIIGNEKIGEYQYESYLNQNASYVFNTAVQNGSIQTKLADETIKWEEKITKNIGVDLALFNNKIEFSAEYYLNEANNLLLQVPIPYSTGVYIADEAIGDIAAPFVNGASMTNKGFEFVLTYRKIEGDFHYDISANITTLKNEVTDLGRYGRPDIRSQCAIYEGHSIGELYGYDFIGIFQTQEQIDEAPVQLGAGPGDCIFRDIDTNGIINDDDRIFLGNAFPSLTGGMNINLEYKGFDLGIFMQGVYGNNVWNGVYQRLNSYALGNYSIESYNNYWRGEGTSTEYPRLTETDPNGNNLMSKRWVQDGSYLKVQNVQLGYTFSEEMLSFIPQVSLFRVYVSAQNLFTFTKYTGYDPDFDNDGLIYRGIDYGSYPSPRTFLIGLKLSF